jgi:feruloyl esterase
MGKKQDGWMRLFMVPGMNHCRGGPGPDTFDSLGTLEKWREQSVQPDRIMGSNSTSGLSRPICPYPQYAAYKGTGDVKDAANFVCKAP